MGCTASLLVPCEDDEGYQASLSNNSIAAAALASNSSSTPSDPKTQTQTQTKTQPPHTSAESRAYQSRPLRFQPVRFTVVYAEFPFSFINVFLFHWAV